LGFLNWSFEAGLFILYGFFVEFNLGFFVFGPSVVFNLGFSVFGLFIAVWHFDFGLFKLGF
jgi:hypothetical protein